jgi:hypothetical protein
MLGRGDSPVLTLVDVLDGQVDELFVVIGTYGRVTWRASVVPVMGSVASTVSRGWVCSMGLLVPSASRTTVPAMKLCTGNNYAQVIREQSTEIEMLRTQTALPNNVRLFHNRPSTPRRHSRVYQ